LSNTRFPHRPDLCNRDGRICEERPEKGYKLFLNDELVGFILYAGEFRFVAKIPGLRLEETDQRFFPELTL